MGNCLFYLVSNVANIPRMWCRKSLPIVQ